MVSACVYASIDLLERERIKSQSMKAALLYTTDIVLHFPFDLSSSPPPSFLLFLPNACMHIKALYIKVLHFQNCGSFKCYMQEVGRQ